MEIRNWVQTPTIEFKDIYPYWDKLLKELHSKGILFCYATDKEILTAYSKVKKTESQNVKRT